MMLKQFFLITFFSVITLFGVSLQGKSIAAVYLKNADIVLDGKITESAWSQAEVISDFLLHGAKEFTPEKGEARVLTDGKFLYVAVKVFEKNADIYSSADNKNLWAGDVVEIFFGSLVLDNDYRYQVASNPAGMKFASDYDLTSWEVASSIGDNFYSLEFKIPLAKLKFVNHTTQFNIGCYKKNEKKQLVWSHVGSRFKGIERFGELILGDYNSAVSAKFALFCDKKLNRSEYEQLCEKYSAPIWAIEYPPYLHDMGENQVTVSWKTFHQVWGRVLYREKGSNKIFTVKSNLAHGASAGVYTRHHAVLTNLQAGKSYEYQVQTFDYGSESWKNYEDNWQSFSLSEKDKKEFSFVLFTDFHSFGGKLREFMNLPQTKSADFAVNLGDMIDYADFQNDFYSCLVKNQADFAKNRPIFHIRGNHETYGYSPLSFFEVYPHRSGKSYYSFRYGEVIFVVIDCGDDRPFAEMIELAKEQNLYLRELVKSESFRSAEACVILSHMPIIAPKARYSQRVKMILDGVFIGEKPLAEADLLLAGHTHIASITPANSNQAQLFGCDKKCTEAEKVPFAVVCNDGPFKSDIEFSMLHVEKLKNLIRVSVVLENGEVLASHEIRLQER